MSLNRLLSLVSALLFICAGSVFAACPNDIYFKTTKTQYLTASINDAYYRDIDLDGKKDLITLFRTPSNTIGDLVSFYKRNAAGFFDPAVTTTLVPDQFYRAIGGNFGDLNGDGKIDLLLQMAQGSVVVSIRPGDGAGRFAATGPIQFFNLESIYGLADFNGDGRDDVLAGSFSRVYYYFTQADGTFTQGGFFDAYDTARLADFNGDGKLDILLWKNTGTGNFRVMTNLGNGAFDAGVTVSLGPVNATPELIADINNDGKLDIVTGVYIDVNNPSFPLYSVFINNGSSGFTKTTANVTLSTGSQASGFRVTAGDLDGDGDKDVLFSGANEYFTGLNNGGGALTPQRYSPTRSGSLFLEDFDGDGKADQVIMNRSYAASFFPAVLSVSFQKNLCAAPGQTNIIDFNKDGQSDLAAWRPSDGRWSYRTPDNSYEVNWGLGSLGDIPVPQDYDGDGYTDIAVYRASTGVWYIYGSSTGVYIMQFGSPGDKPAPADFDGDGKADIAIFRPSTGSWYVWKSGTSTLDGGSWGLNGDVPLPMDYDGDHKADLAVFRPSEGAWYILRSSDSNFFYAAFGLPGDKLVPADYDNDGAADIAVFRNFNWYIMRVTDGTAFFHGWGQAGDTPLPIYHGDLGNNVAVYRPGDHTFREGFYQSTVPMPGSPGDRIVSYILPLE